MTERRPKRVFAVPPYQVRAAQLAVEMAEEDGREPDPFLVKVANAKPLEYYKVRKPHSAA